MLRIGPMRLTAVLTFFLAGCQAEEKTISLNDFAKADADGEKAAAAAQAAQATPGLAPAEAGPDAAESAREAGDKAEPDHQGH